MHILKKFYNDKYLTLSLISVAFLAACHYIQWIKSGQVQPLIRAIAASVYLLTSLIFGRKCWSIILFLWAMSVVYFNRFINYTSFVMILVAIELNRKAEKPMILLYAVAVSVSLYLYKDSWTHLVIHALGCFFFYLVYKEIVNRLDKLEKLVIELSGQSHPPLVLTYDEENIIRQLAEGKEMKQIEGYCTNTVYAKLKDARVKNGLMRNCQLVEIYVKQKSQCEKFAEE